MVRADRVKKFVEGWRHLRDRDSLKFEPRSNRDWRILIVATFLLFLLVLGGYYFFWRWLQSRGVDRAGMDAAAPSTLLRKEKIDEVATEIKQRVADYAFYLENRSTTTDPAE